MTLNIFINIYIFLPTICFHLYLKKSLLNKLWIEIRFLKYSIYSQVAVVHLNEQKLSSFWQWLKKKTLIKFWKFWITREPLGVKRLSDKKFTEELNPL